MGSSPVRVGGQFHPQFTGCWRRHGADAGSHHIAVHFDFTGAATSAQASGGNVHPSLPAGDKPVLPLGAVAAATIWPLDGHHHRL